MRQKAIALIGEQYYIIGEHLLKYVRWRVSGENEVSLRSGWPARLCGFRGDLTKKIAAAAA